MSLLTVVRMLWVTWSSVRHSIPSAAWPGAGVEDTVKQVTGRDLERFFHDWTERAGNPALEVRTTYLPRGKQAKVVIRQTQPGEAFQMPPALDAISRCT